MRRHFNFCSLIFLFILPIFSKGQLNFNLNNTYCTGESDFLVANTGTLTPNSYTWFTSSASASISSLNAPSTSIYFLQAGIYTVNLSATSGTMISTVSHTVKAKPLPTLIIAGPTTICNNATLIASGASNYTWSFSGGGVTLGSSLTVNYPSPSGTYTLVGENNVGCESSTTVSVENGTLPVPSIAITSFTTCVGSTVTLTAMGALTYFLSAPSLTAISAFQQSVAIGVGVYTVTGSNGGNCVSSQVLSIWPASCTGVDELNTGSGNFKCFPNPAKDQITILSNGEIEATVEIIDALGKLIVKQANCFAAGNLSECIRVNEFPPGVYFVRLSTSKSAPSLLKLIKE